MTDLPFLNVFINEGGGITVHYAASTEAPATDSPDMTVSVQQIAFDLNDIEHVLSGLKAVHEDAKRDPEF